MNNLARLPAFRFPSPSILAILSDKQLFGDGQPIWIELQNKRNERNCESAEDAQQRRERTIDLLRRHGVGNVHALMVARKLERCVSGRRCCSGACPECGRALQRWFVQEMQRSLTKEGFAQPDLYLASVVPDYASCPINQLGDFRWKEGVVRRTADVLRAVGFELACGGADFSVNQTLEGPGELTIQGQFWLLVHAPPVNYSAHVRNLINPSGTIERPIRLQRFDGDAAGLAYALKTIFFRRESYIADNAKRSDRGGSANTRNRPLRGEAWLRLMIFLDRIGLDARLILLGARRTYTRQGVEIDRTTGRYIDW